MKPYIEHNGHKVVLSITIEKKGDGWQTTMYVGKATDMTSLINELDKAKVEYADELRNGASLVVDIQDHLPEEGCHWACNGCDKCGSVGHGL